MNITDSTLKREELAIFDLRKLYEQFIAAPRHFLLLGKEQGFSSDFGHVEMLVSKEAQGEVWPLVEHWLRELQLPPEKQQD